MSQLESLQSKLHQILEECEKAFFSAANREALYQQKVLYLGKQGQLTQLMKEMGALPPDLKPQFGALVNQAKVKSESLWEEREKTLARTELQQKLQEQKLDVSLPGPQGSNGHFHPVWQVTLLFTRIMEKLGYSMQLGPLVESDYFNFEALNMPAHHPARDMQDTFFVDETHVLRTHTSPVWSRALSTQKPPFRMLGTGAVFRCDSDASHLPHFHQFEGVLVDQQVSLSDLKGTVGYVVREFFGGDIQTRFRPSYFPFTEPSAEVDCTCPVCRGKGCSLCKSTGWIEIGGCGLINPKVLLKAGLNEQHWQGFAFGFGLERMAMIRYGISDIRQFPINDLRFLNQFNEFGA